MTEQRCLLILGGTGDAAALAQTCADTFPRLRIINSLAGRTRQPAPLAGETHVGGFGGVQGLAKFITDNQVSVCIDATHPFATQISQHAMLACMESGVARLQLLRKPWTATAGDQWLEVDDMDAAASTLAERFTGAADAHHRRVFLSTGRKQLSSFAHLQKFWFLIRTVDSLDDPQSLPHCHALVDRGPFDIDSEHALLEQHRIDIVISKNSGGNATFAKIVAARRLHLPVIMLRRPAPPAGPTAYSIEVCVDWLSTRL